MEMRENYKGGNSENKNPHKHRPKFLTQIFFQSFSYLLKFIHNSCGDATVI